MNSLLVTNKPEFSRRVGNKTGLSFLIEIYGKIILYNTATSEIQKHLITSTP